MKVLVSHGYGTGWSTANCKEMAIDKDLIALFERGCTKDEMIEECRRKGYGYPYSGYVCMLGYKNLVVKEVPKGSLFKIREYDGFEWIEIFDKDEWFYAEE